MTLAAAAAVAYGQMPPQRPEYVQVDIAGSGRDYVARRSIGHVEAVRTVHVSTAVEGFLSEVCFKEGALVNEGDVLFRIDPLRYQAAVQQAEANLAAIDAQIIYATNNFNRLSSLMADNATSAQARDASQARLEELKASRAGAQADLVKARKNLDDCTIRAEISGRVGRVKFTKGNYVTIGEQLVTIMQADPIYVRFPLSQSDVNGAFGGPQRIGSITDVRLITASGAVYPASGRVTIVDNRLSGSTDSYTLWAEFPNPDHALIPQGIGALVITLTDTMEVTTVPLTAVQHDASGAFVYIVHTDKQSTVERCEVVAGSIRGRLQSIYEGIRPGEMVITDGAHKTRRGARVIPVLASDKHAAASAPNATQQPALQPVKVKICEVTSAPDSTVLVCQGARVEAINQVDIRPLVQGILDEPVFKEGGYVNEGDVLFRIDPTRYQAEVDAQTSAIHVLEARINEAKLNLNRRAQLLELNATSRDEYESAKATYDDLIAKKSASEAALTIARDNLERCTVRAGITGIIGRTNFSKGNFIVDIKSPLAALLQVSPIYVRFSLSENAILTHFGTTDRLVEDAQISLVTATGKELPEIGRVSFCDNVVQTDTDTMNIWAEFTNASRELQPGGVVTIRVARKADKPVPTVPAEAVLIDTRGHYVYALRHGRAVQVRILCGSATPEGTVPVYSGLTVGDRVITTNLAELEDGTVVSVD